MNFPSSRRFIDHLITELSTFNPPSTPTTNPPNQPESRTQPQSTPQNPLDKLPATELNKVKPIILTLHCLFPNDLLPALDILDRHLVQHLETNPTNQTPTSVPDENHATNAYGTTQTETPHHPTKSKSLFLVTSASSIPRQNIPISTSGPTQDPSKAYEVRLEAWNCTCPTFTLSIFKNPDLSSLESEIPQLQGVEDNVDLDPDSEVDYPFGGTLICDTDRGSPGICKHILACVLFARCPGLFGGGGGRLIVSLEEIAGWCAGWGG